MTSVCLLTVTAVLTVLAVIASCIACVHLANSTHCHSVSGRPRNRYYGSKTTYTIARQTLRNHSFSYELPNCKPIMLYFIGRHAIRYPDADDIVEMSRVLPKLKQNIFMSAEQGMTELCDQDLKALRDWTFKMREIDDNRISESGIAETKAIAKEFKSRYPSLFNGKAMIEVGVTNKERTSQTADAFLQEINFDKNDENAINGAKVNIAEQSFLYFHDTCEELLLNQGVKLGKPKVVIDYRNSQLMQTFLKRVNHRLGFRHNHLIDSKLLKHVLRACHFDFAIYGESPWCALFSDDELKLLEYLDDIEDFYEDAYGRDINSKQTCPLIGDLLEKVKSILKSGGKKTYLRFTHAGVIKRLYTGFGLFNDINSGMLLSSEEFCLHDNRKWKSSLVSPFSANFAAVLYKCKNKNKKEDKNNVKYKILTLVQETPVTLNGCDSAFCAIDQFLNTYEETALNCNLDEICRI